MQQIRFQQVFNQAYEHCKYNEEIKKSLHTLWQQGVQTFETLYGDQAHTVIEMCYKVNPRFCLHVVTVVYGMHWSWQHPTDYDKSLITNICLILDENFNQFKVLLQTFLQSAEKNNLNGASILLEAVDYLSEHKHITQKTKVEATNTIKEHLNSNQILSHNLTDKELDIINLSVLATLQKDINNVSFSDAFTKEQQLQLIFHANTYIGCPKVWDVSIALQGNTL